jgi:F-type H+-transporting ATPase subunit alpha
VGGNAQIRAMRKVAGSLRLDLAQYREMAAFAQFGSELDKATQAQLARGSRLVEILKQPQYKPLPVEKQVLIIYAGTNGYLEGFPEASLKKYEDELFTFVDKKYPEVTREIREKKEISSTLQGKLDQVFKEFNVIFKP